MDTPNSSSPSRTPVKELPAKLGKNIKRQFHRISERFHVTPPKPRKRAVSATLPIVTTAIISPLSPAFPVFVPKKKSPSIKSSKSSEGLRLWLRSSQLPPGSAPIYDTMSDHSSLSQCPSFPPGEIPRSSVEVPPPSVVLSEEQVEDRSTAVQEESEDLADAAGAASSDATSEEPTLESSSSAVYIEPEVPNPFLIDDEEEASESDEQSSNRLPLPSTSQLTISLATQSAPSVSVPLSSPAPQSLPLSLPTLNVEKDVPPTPTGSESGDDNAPELYLSGLVVPSMFLPIPNTDPLSTLLAKYIDPPEDRPTRDISGEWQGSDYHTLVMTNSWRALAQMARDRLITTNPEDVNLILGLWYIRLACLARLRLFNQTSVECTNLSVVLNGIEPPDARAWLFERLLPFELEVMQARVTYWAGDHMGYLDALYALLSKCKFRARVAEANNDEVCSMWRERGARLCLIIASQLVEMKEFRSATKLLEPLCEQGEVSTASLRSAVGRIYLQSGQVTIAAKHFAIVAEDPVADQSLKDTNASLLACAEGNWETASSLLESIIEKDAENLVAVNNLSVSLLCQGKLKEGIKVLEHALNASPSAVVVVEPFLFNLSTLYELRSTTAAENKRNLLIEVAKWSGDGLRVACLKMPTN